MKERKGKTLILCSYILESANQGGKKWSPMIFFEKERSSSLGRHMDSSLRLQLVECEDGFTA